MPNALESVKALSADFRRSARDSEAENPARAKRQLQSADALDELILELEQSRKRLRPLSTDFGDLSDLPEEVMQQLNLAKVDELEQQMRDIVAAANGKEVGLDQIIIELYRRHKVMKPRTYIMNKLYRMAQKGTIHSVEGKKGSYTVPAEIRDWASSNPFDDDDSEVPF